MTLMFDGGAKNCNIFSKLFSAIFEFRKFAILNWSSFVSVLQEFWSKMIKFDL